ncbi:response regulator transcription factor [Priestia aryabhattai]|uniref:response regulator transcription factor n=1 Tax=Priestia aryabhattai TaxID=412384 RepID=UPI001CFC94ED|nr:response regulator transcription factor [Priestia aryabhattai]
MINILIVDDHLAVAQGTKFILEQESCFKVEVEHNTSNVLEIMNTQEYQVVVTDLHMPELNGIDLANLINNKFDTKIIIYTGYDIGNYFNLLISSGVVGFVSKTSTAKGLVNAINAALNNEAIIPIELLRQLRKSSLNVLNNNMSVNLSINDEEQTILLEIEKGSTNKEIAQKLYVSQRTIEHRLTNIFQKLHVNSRLEAVNKAKKLGIIYNDIPISF